MAGHTDCRFYLALADRLPALQPLVQALQRRLGRLNARRITADRHPVAAGRKFDAQTLFEPDQVSVMIAEQQRQKRVVGKLESKSASGHGGDDVQAQMASGLSVPDNDVGLACWIVTLCCVPINVGDPSM